MWHVCFGLKSVARVAQVHGKSVFAGSRLMGDSGNTTLELLWKSGRVGNLCPLEQLKAMVYREVLLETGTPEHKLNSTIATKLKKLGGGAVTRQAVGQLLAKYDEDAEWYPGKSYQTSFGPAPALNGAKRRCVAQAAMSLKQQDLEPTYALVLAQCPKAALNPNTKKPVDKKVIYEIMRTECYDDDENPDDTWSHRPRLQKTALTEEAKEKRWEWAKQVLRENLLAAWYYRHVVWVDICNSILPRSELAVHPPSSHRSKADKAS